MSRRRQKYKSKIIWNCQNEGISNEHEIRRLYLIDQGKIQRNFEQT
jgi:hypothetical protein